MIFLSFIFLFAFPQPVKANRKTNDRED